MNQKKNKKRQNSYTIKQLLEDNKFVMKNHPSLYQLKKYITIGPKNLPKKIPVTSYTSHIT